MCVRVCMFVCLCVCVCVFERERERGDVACIFMHERVCESVCLFVRDIACACACECGRERERERERSTVVSEKMNV